MTASTIPNVVTEHPTLDTQCDAGQDVLASLLRAYDSLWSELTKFFQRFDLTPQQYNVLKALASCGGGVACQAIAEQLLNRVPDITRLLDRLEQAGMIRRERCCDDRRVVRTYLTDAGRSKVEAVRGPLAEALKARFGHMSQEDLKTLNRLLGTLREPPCAVARSAFHPDALGSGHDDA
ncbi:MAG: MarR family winged helix-turn-helix transcriptional regulator [Myxococcales bacterium]